MTRTTQALVLGLVSLGIAVTARAAQDLAPVRAGDGDSIEVKRCDDETKKNLANVTT